jgi:hypothetical protein
MKGNTKRPTTHPMLDTRCSMYQYAHPLMGGWADRVSRIEYPGVWAGDLQ